MKTFKIKTTYFMAIGFFLVGFNLAAQTESTTPPEEVVQVSGLVVTSDSLMPLPFATVFRTRDSRGYHDRRKRLLLTTSA